MTSRQVQHLLAYLGYDPGGVDGIIGRATLAAVKRFQGDYGLTADGNSRPGHPGEAGGSRSRYGGEGLRAARRRTAENRQLLG